MAKLLLNLRHVPDDEADDVRAMLDAARIGFYETPPSVFGISAGGIYVRENDDVPEAKRLMADSQAQRGARVSLPSVPVALDDCAVFQVAHGRSRAVRRADPKPAAALAVKQRPHQRRCIETARTEPFDVAVRRDQRE